VQFIQKNSFVLFSGILFICLLAYGMWIDETIISLLPYVAIVLFVAVFYTEYTFFFILFATPLSINIEEFNSSFGLFIPTEPLLFGTLIILLFQHIKYVVFPSYLWRSAIVWTVFLYLLWIFITSITSEYPVVSFKFLLAKLWFIVPILLYGSTIFINPKKINWFLWLFTTAMIIVIIYTLVVHLGYRFGEKESHWVMWPFFKDHTIYGALVALVVPLIFAFYRTQKNTPVLQFILLGFFIISLLGLYFSYTRAAWLSVVLGIGVWALVRYKVRFSLLFFIALGLGVYVWSSWVSIQQDLSRNKNEHTTEDFGKRLQSATNVTSDASNLERINRWSCAIDMYNERPMVGFGPGTYAFEYARFQRPENLTIISTNFGNLGNAHSEFLGALAETGLIGMLLFMALVAAIFYEGITLYHAWPASDKNMRTLLIGFIVALSTYFIHGLLNNFLDTDKAAVPIWTICAIFIALKEKLRKDQLANNN
jgi:O-antigen ligase